MTSNKWTCLGLTAIFVIISITMNEPRSIGYFAGFIVSTLFLITFFLIDSIEECSQKTGGKVK